MPPETPEAETPEVAASVERPTVGVVSPTGELAAETPELSAEALESSSPFIGQWNTLVSTTNWEKGRIIGEWREALRRSDAAVTEYSDEAWARLVGGVTSQHVGRLRRAHERFGGVYDQYQGLYWSHFQAALDWEDAEMWLEGAIARGHSVSQMRAARWEAVGGPGAEAPDAQVIETQLDEDAYTAFVGGDEPKAATKDEGPAASEPREGDAGSSKANETDTDAPAPWEDAASDDSEAPTPAQRVRPFAGVAALPDDVADAFEQFKLVILSHKLSGWDAIGRDDLLGALDALKALAVAPSDDGR